jgi:hypothetical protein
MHRRVPHRRAGDERRGRRLAPDSRPAVAVARSGRRRRSRASRLSDVGTAL